MTAGARIGIALFMAAWGIGVTAWVLGIAEFIGILRFTPWVYRLGLCVLREHTALHCPAWPSSGPSTVETPSGRARILGPTECLFRPPLLHFGVHTPFPLKGTVQWQGVRAEVVCRLPMTSFVFFVAWLVGWTVGAAMALLSPGGHFMGAAFLLGGWAFAGALSWFSIRLELQRARTIMEELNTALSRAAA